MRDKDIIYCDRNVALAVQFFSEYSEKESQNECSACEVPTLQEQHCYSTHYSFPTQGQMKRRSETMGNKYVGSTQHSVAIL